MKGSILVSDIWVSDPKLMFFADIRIFKVMVKYEDTPATERYFDKLLLVVRHTICKKWPCGKSTFDAKFDKNLNFGGYFWPKSPYWLRPPYI